MGLVQDTAICTIAQAEGVTHEPALANLDDEDADATFNATFANALKEATNELIRRCRLKWSIDDPSTISDASVTDMRAFASLWACFTTLAASPDDVQRLRAVDYKARAEEQWRGLVVTFTSGTSTISESPKGIPRWATPDVDPYHGPINNRPRGIVPSWPVQGSRARAQAPAVR